MNNKKASIVSAQTWNGDNVNDISEFIPGAIISEDKANFPGRIKVETGAQTLFVEKGDSIVELSDETFIVMREVTVDTKRTKLPPEMVDAATGLILLLQKFNDHCSEYKSTAELIRTVESSNLEHEYKHLYDEQRNNLNEIDRTGEAIIRYTGAFIWNQYKPLKITLNYLELRLREALSGAGIDFKEIDK